MNTMTLDLSAPVETTMDGWAIIARDYWPDDPSHVGGDVQMGEGASTRLTFLDSTAGAVVEVTIYAYPTAYSPGEGQLTTMDTDHEGEVRWSADAMLCWERWDSLADYLASAHDGSCEGSYSDVTYEDVADNGTWARDEDDARERARRAALDYARNAALYICPGSF